MGYLRETTSRKPIYWCCRNKSRLSTEIKSLLTERDFIHHNQSQLNARLLKQGEGSF
jgi:hypothetical protein